jgi:hypothetical protein
MGYTHPKMAIIQAKALGRTTQSCTFAGHIGMFWLHQPRFLMVHHH